MRRGAKVRFASMLRESRSRSCSSPVRPASAFARSPVTATTTSWTASRRSTGRRPIRCRSTPSVTRAPSKTIYAVLVLAHESYHTSGVADEAAANCFAIQAMAWTAMQLGAAAGEAELLARAMEALEPEPGRRVRDGRVSCREKARSPPGDRPHSRPSTRSRRRSAAAACRRSSAGR